MLRLSMSQWGFIAPPVRPEAVFANDSSLAEVLGVLGDATHQPTHQKRKRERRD
jgi:hypothetical protein